MKKMLVMLLAVALLCGVTASAFASDWDVAGKVLTGIAGLRILTGGKVDIIGNIAGLQGDQRQVVYETRRPHYEYAVNSRRVWVPQYVWEKRWIPAQREYNGRGRMMFIEGHYNLEKVQRGGYWAYERSSYR